MKLPLQTPREKWIVLVLVAFWAVLYLPNLRTSPNWYGDEGEWMEKCWQFAHGTTHIGPINNDFIYPYPYPPLYMAVNGALLRVFGDDVVVGRALGSVTALLAAVILFWIGSRLRSKNFGFLCAAAFLCYSEADINFRWVRSHPFAGMLALASIGFLVRYVQEKRLRDALWAGVFCSLAAATNYFTYPLAAAVGITVLVVNIRDLKTAKAWGHILAAGIASGAYVALFVLWYVTAHSLAQLKDHVHLLTSVASNEIKPTLGGEIQRFVENVFTLGFKTPAKFSPDGSTSYDWWLRIATVGFFFLPVTKSKWLRAWVPFWLLVLMYGVFKKLNNVPIFFYPATIFLPLMAIGFAGVLAWIGEGFVKASGKESEGMRWGPGIAVVAIFGTMTAQGALTHFETKIDRFAQQSVPDAEAAMKYVNDRTTSNDVVIVPKQIYWTIKNAHRNMLTYAARYDGPDNDMPVPTHIPKDLYWFDPSLDKTKYVVMEYGVQEVTMPDGRRGQLPMGIDAVYTIPVLRGVRELVVRMQQEKWPLVFHQGLYIVLANPQLVKETK